MLNNFRYKKEKLLKALEETQGLIYHACKKAGNISRSTYYRYMREDKEFAKAVEEIKEAQGDYVEGQLIKNISKGKETSIIFYLKSKAKDRGYTEKSSALSLFCFTKISPFSITTYIT